FVRFWFHLVASRRSAFSQVSHATRAQWIQEGLSYLYGSIWEELCRQALPRLSESWEDLYIQPGRFWESQGFEWDVLSESAHKTHFLIGECKWTEKTPSIESIHGMLDALRRKGIPPVHRPENAKLSYVLFVPEKPFGLKLGDGVRVVDAQEVVNALK